MNIACIPARGNSKGIPKKNLSLVAGVPLVVRTVRQARLAETVHEVIVSTDDNEIAFAAADEGAIVQMRSDWLAGDMVVSEDVILDVLKHHPATLCAFLQCTSPFTMAAEIDACMLKLEREHLDCVFTVERTHSGYWVMDPTGIIRCMNYDTRMPRPPRQIGPVCWRETGGVYALRAESFMAAKTRFCGKLGVFEVSERSGIEIDNPFDLVIARAIGETYLKVGYREDEAARCASTPDAPPEAFPGSVVAK